MIFLRSFLILLLLILFTFANAGSKTYPSGMQSFVASRDSLQQLLSKVGTTDGARRLQLLNHLNDIDQILGDTTHLMPLWYEAVRQKDVSTIDDIAVSMTMRYLRRGVQDSVDVWLERINRYLPEPRCTENIE